jgi:hypothetical protein
MAVSSPRAPSADLPQTQPGAGHEPRPVRAGPARARRPAHRRPPAPRAASARRCGSGSWPCQRGSPRSRPPAPRSCRRSRRAPEPRAPPGSGPPWPGARGWPDRRSPPGVPARSPPARLALAAAGPRCAVRPRGGGAHRGRGCGPAAASRSRLSRGPDRRNRRCATSAGTCPAPGPPPDRGRRAGPRPGRTRAARTGRRVPRRPSAHRGRTPRPAPHPATCQAWLPPPQALSSPPPTPLCPGRPGRRGRGQARCGWPRTVP